MILEKRSQVLQNSDVIVQVLRTMTVIGIFSKKKKYSFRNRILTNPPNTRKIALKLRNVRQLSVRQPVPEV